MPSGSPKPSACCSRPWLSLERTLKIQNTPLLRLLGFPYNVGLYFLHWVDKPPSCINISYWFQTTSIFEKCRCSGEKTRTMGIIKGLELTCELTLQCCDICVAQLKATTEVKHKIAAYKNLCVKYKEGDVFVALKRWFTKCSMRGLVFCCF